MRTISQQFARWLNVALILALLSNLLFPISLASASSQKSAPSAWRSASFSGERHQPFLVDAVSTDNRAVKRDIFDFNNDGSPQIINPAPHNFSLPFPFNSDTLSQKSALAQVSGDWSPAVMINDSPSIGDAPAVAVRGNLAYAVWADAQSTELVLARSTDGGQTWDPQNVQITNNGNSPRGPAIAIAPNGGTIYIAFYYQDDIGPVVNVIRSTNGGQSWSQINSSSSYMGWFNLAIDGNGYLYLLLYDTTRTYILNSQEQGQTWQETLSLSNYYPGGWYCGGEGLLASGTVVYFVYEVCDGSNALETYQSQNGGQSWVLKSSVTVPAGTLEDAIANGTNEIYQLRTVWNESTSTNSLRVQASHDEGVTWPVNSEVVSSFSGNPPRIAARGPSRPVIGWRSMTGSDHLQVAESTDGGQNWSTGTNLGTMGCNNHDLAADPATEGIVAVWGWNCSTLYASASVGSTQTYAITGTVTWTESGNPISEVTVEARQGSTTVQTATTQTDGTYEITGLAAGSYELSVPVANADNGLLTFVSAADPDSSIIQITLNGDVTDQDFVASIEDPTSSRFKGANWLDLDDTGYPGSNVGWNLELSDTMEDFVENDPDPDHPNGNDIDTLFNDQSVHTIVRLELDPPPANLRSGDCQNLIDNWVISGVNADRQYEIMVNRISENSDAIPIFVLDNEPNLDWGVTAEEYAHIYNCYYQYWRLERNYPHRLFVAGPGDGGGMYDEFYQQLLNIGSETITYADGFALHAYGYCEDCAPEDGRDGPRDYLTPAENPYGDDWISGFSYWVDGWNNAVSNRPDLQDRPVIITEYNPGAQVRNGNTLTNTIRRDTNGEMWEDWFDKTYCWAQRIDPLIGLLYFVDEGHHSRIADASRPGHDWEEVSLEIRPDTARDAWLHYDLNQDCHVTLFTSSFQNPIFRGQDYQVLTAGFQGQGAMIFSVPPYHPQAQSLVTGGLISGTISGELGVEGLDNVFYVTDDLEVPAGQTLTIAQGTTLVFAPNLRMDIAGQLIAEGNSVFPIRFAGLTETGWSGLHFQTTAQNSRCVGCYVENVDDNGVAVTVDAPITFKDGQVRDIEGGTAIAATVSFTLSNVVIDNVGLGLDLSDVTGQIK